MKLQIAIIGLGKFGLNCGQTLMNLGHEVLGIDSGLARIKAAQAELTQVFQADATSREVLEQIRLQDFNEVLVSVGDAIAASAMIVMYLKEMGVKRVWAKAINEDHAKLLGKIGVDEVLIPEFMAAKQVAARMIMPGFIGNMPFDRSMAAKEIPIDKWAGRSLRELDLTNRHHLQVIAIKRKEEEIFRYIPKADDILAKGDVLVAIGDIATLAKIIS